MELLQEQEQITAEYLESKCFELINRNRDPIDIDLHPVHENTRKFLLTKKWDRVRCGEIYVNCNYMYKKMGNTELILREERLCINGEITSQVLGHLISTRNAYRIIYLSDNSSLPSNFFFVSAQRNHVYGVNYDHKIKIGCRYNSGALSSYTELNATDAKNAISDDGYTPVPELSYSWKAVSYNPELKKFKLVQEDKIQITKDLQAVAEYTSKLKEDILHYITEAEFHLEIDCDAYDMSCSIFTSCMADLVGDCSPLNEFYPNIKEWQGLAHLEQNEDLKARCHVYKFDNVIYVDRIYPNDKNNRYNIQIRDNIIKHYKDNTVQFRENDHANIPRDEGYKLTWDSTKAPSFIPHLDTFPCLAASSDTLYFKMKTGSTMAYAHGSYAGGLQCHGEDVDHDEFPTNLDEFIQLVRDDDFSGNKMVDAIDAIEITVNWNGTDIQQTSTESMDTDDCYYSEYFGDYVTYNVYQALRNIGEEN